MSNVKSVALTDGPLAGNVIIVPVSSCAYQALEYDDPPLPRMVNGTWQWPALEAHTVTYSYYQYCYVLTGSPVTFWIGCCRGRPAHQDVMIAMTLLGVPGAPSLSPADGTLRVRVLTRAELELGRTGQL